MTPAAKIKQSKSAGAVLALFSFTLFISAGLMFAVQPMIGKMLLPLIGGTPAGWIVTVAFFQLMLLAGYFFAYILSLARPRRHGFLYIIALLTGIWFLPLHLGDNLSEKLPVSVEILRLLAVTTAVPFIAISATSSTIQRLFTETGHPSASDPYFLYAASNLGSFTGLFAYPLLAEPLMGIATQTYVWAGGFMTLLLLAAACLFCAYTVQKSQPADGIEKTEGARVTHQQRMMWILLAFIPSSLLSGITTHLSTDIFSAPMIWVLPLGVYLMTFVIAFSRKSLIGLPALARLHLLTVPLVLAFLMTPNLMIRLSWPAVSFHLLAFGIAALLCHARLAQIRPENSRKHLSEFYLMIAIGGALGGILNAFIIPYTLDRLIEYPLLMILSLLLNPKIYDKATQKGTALITASLACACGIYIFIKTISPDIYANAAGLVTPKTIMADIVFAAMFIAMASNLRAALAGCLSVFMLYEFILPKNVLLTERNFFGVITIFERPLHIGGKEYTARYMYHGTTTHGTQIMEKPYNKTPTTYFTTLGPLGNIFQLYQPKKTAVLGLGVGTMNCYATPETEMTFIEIDQSVIDIARSHFTFLDDCTGRTPPKIISGDGRLEMQKLDEKFDLIILDAFSSDTIPIHLMTTNALDEYRKKLNENGIILVNISNRYFNLAPILTRNAAETGLYTRTRLHYFGDAEWNKHPYASPSFWVAMAQNDNTLMPLHDMGWVELEADKKMRPWTDDYSSPMLMLHRFAPIRIKGAAQIE